MTKRIGVAAVFLVGCAVGGASSQLVVPKASAEQAASGQQWEYFCTNMGRLHGPITDRANSLAIERWELAGVIDHDQWCWK
jgi:hypothetical protein